MTRDEFISESRKQGFMRDCPEWVSCGVDLCCAPGVCEALSVGDRTERTFVPLCDAHLSAFYAGERLEWVVEVHGCWLGHNIAP